MNVEPRRHVLTVALEDYFHVGAFNRLIQRGEWYRFESRLDRSVRATLDLLAESGVHATFFVLGWVADSFPELVRAVADGGHEVASKGYYHRSIRHMSPDEFREDLARARESLERAGGQQVRGYRVADRWLEPSDLWALEVLAGQGYAYDSSIAPLFRRYVEPRRFEAHENRFGDRVLWEFPISTTGILGMRVPIAGGNWFRQFPQWLVRRAVASWDRHRTAPFVMYFHTWELDTAQPRITAAPLLQRVRQYRNLDRMPSIIRYFLSRYRFTSVREYLGLEEAPVAVPAPPRAPLRVVTDVQAPPAGAVPLTVVVPCHNEELILPYLANTLRSVSELLAGRYALRFTFVDDGSTDGTWNALQHLFGRRTDCQLIRSEANRGVAAAIRRGIQTATTPVVASIDCDCTYDPHELAQMVPLLTEGVDLVTASPYHPRGAVVNVPGWRLLLSRRLSSLYRLVLRNRLHTYTSCFRVYRREVAAAVPVERGGFLGVTEMLGRIDLAGGRIVEYPTTLRVRILGRSKMRVLVTILGHLRLLGELALLRVRGGGGAALAAAMLPLAAGA